MEILSPPLFSLPGNTLCVLLFQGVVFPEETRQRRNRTLRSTNKPFCLPQWKSVDRIFWKVALKEFTQSTVTGFCAAPIVVSMGSEKQVSVQKYVLSFFHGWKVRELTATQKVGVG